MLLQLRDRFIDSAKSSMILEPDIELVKQRLRMGRAALGLSQREAAERAGISRSVLVKYEARDNRRIPNTRQVFRLAVVYGLSIDYLLGRADPGKDRG